MMEFVDASLRALGWAPPWAVSLIVLGVAAVIGLTAHAVAEKVAARVVRGRDEFWRSLVARIAKPSRLAFLIVFLGVGAGLAPLTSDQKDLLGHSLLIGFIAFLGWAALTALDIAASLYMRRFRIDEADNLVARKHLTQVRILQRACATLIVVLTLAFALMTISSVRQWGVSLLAAGGAAGIIVGLALQPLLTNLIAGLQIAMTQPIRIDDAVIVEGEWGNVEEIGGTYVVIRIWDKRRLIVPLSYFMDQPFQNWTRADATLIGVVMLYVDYAVSIPDLRLEAERIVRASPLWDRDVFALQVTDFRETVTEVRILASARNAGRAFDLRCEIREHLLAYLQTDQPHAMPRHRGSIQMDDRPDRSAGLAEKGIIEVKG